MQSDTHSDTSLELPVLGRRVERSASTPLAELSALGTVRRGGSGHGMKVMSCVRRRRRAMSPSGCHER